MRPSWRGAVLAVAVALSATACGGSSGEKAAPAPPASSSADPASAAAAAAFQDALDRLVIDRALARTDRAEAALRFNTTDSDRTAAIDQVKAACAKLSEVYATFSGRLQAVQFAAMTDDVDALLDVTGRLVEVLSKYAAATTPDQFTQIDAEEKVATAGWEETVNSVAAALGVRGLGASPTSSPSSTATAAPTDTPSAGPTPS